MAIKRGKMSTFHSFLRKKAKKMEKSLYYAERLRSRILPLHQKFESDL